LPPKLIAIVGPTASGKSALALALATRLEGEIIGADSRQVYIGMDIGTAKPTLEQRNAVPHHLVNILPPDEPFSLGDWLTLARRALDDIWRRGKLPILVGGSGQYVWALLENWLVPQVPPQPELRRQMEERAALEGVPSLYSDLERLDPEAASRVDRRNPRRVIRALEVFYAIGRARPNCTVKEAPPWDALVLGLKVERKDLYDRIDARIDSMIASGLIEEVKQLIAFGYSPTLPALSGIGYKEACSYLGGELTLDQAIASMKTETHRFVRHQNNWFKPDDPRIHWLNTDAAVASRAALLVEGFLAARQPLEKVVSA